MVINNGFLGCGVVETTGLGSGVAGATDLNYVVVRTTGLARASSTGFARGDVKWLQPLLELGFVLMV